MLFRPTIITSQIVLVSVLIQGPFGTTFGNDVLKVRDELSFESMYLIKMNYLE